MFKLPPARVLLDEDAMRAFYETCGISKATTEAAIKVRRKNLAQQDNQKQPPTDQKRNGRD
jgi:hypothetical protein